MGDSSSMNRTLNGNDAVQLTGKIMMIAILVLFLVVLFVLCLHLYAKWCWWRAEDDAAAAADSSNHHRRRRRRRFVFAPGQDPVATVRKGLEPLVLRSLPVIVFPSDDFKDGLECAVCLSELAEGEKARLLPKCSHGFHVDCIDMWFQSHSTCPLCRNPVAPEVSGDSSSAGSSSMAAESLTSAQISSPGENSASGFSAEGPNFPTNVLFWGDQTRVSSRVGSGLEEDGPGPSGSSSAPSDVSRPEMLVIDILNEASFVIPSASPSPSGNRYAADEDLKSPVTTRLRSLKRLLSRDRRISPSSPTSSVDVEQGGRGAQS